MGLDAPKSRWVYDGDFAEYDPDPQLARYEQIGVKDGGKESLSYIEAGDLVPDEFPQQLTDFLNRVWQSAKANTARPQKLLMGAHRGKPVVDILPDPYVSRLHNPAPIPRLKIRNRSSIFTASPKTGPSWTISTSSRPIPSAAKPPSGLPRM